MTDDSLFVDQGWMSGFTLNLDLPGLLYVEAAKRIESAFVKLRGIELGLAKHSVRVSETGDSPNDEVAEDRWVDVIQGVGGFEPDCAAALTDLAVADITLVTSSEAYINLVAQHVLEGKESAHFDKLSPVAKWLFLPRIINLSWQPRLGEEPLQGFSELVSRRNRWIHPKGIINPNGIVDLKGFLNQCGLDISTAHQGMKSVRELMQGFCMAWKGSYGPDWLDAESAKEHPPCFFLGDVELYARLGRPGE